MKVPIPENLLAFIGIFVLTITVVYILWFILSRFRDLFFKKKGQKKKEHKYNYSCFGCLFKILFVAALFWFGVSLLSIAALTQSYYRLTEQKLVAEVICEPTSFQDYSMRFTITRLDGKTASKPVSYYLHGDKWFIEGDILKWRPWLNIIGLQSMYRISRVGGTYWKKEDIETKHESIEDIAGNELPEMWDKLYKYYQNINIIQGVYTDRIATLPARNQKFNIYITSGGFTLESISMEQ
ncbi:hypothetical protein JW960_17405 [candidate division KSB1 bacterium]|nr:hypothetical protein [candidate division KSB1 bacterium]